MNSSVFMCCQDFRCFTVCVLLSTSTVVVALRFLVSVPCSSGACSCSCCCCCFYYCCWWCCFAVVKA